MDWLKYLLGIFVFLFLLRQLFDLYENLPHKKKETFEVFCTILDILHEDGKTEIYALYKKVEEVSNIYFRTGRYYPLIYEMDNKGWINVYEEYHVNKDGKKVLRKICELTEGGKKEKKNLKSPFTNLSEMPELAFA